MYRIAGVVLKMVLKFNIRKNKQKVSSRDNRLLIMNVIAGIGLSISQRDLKRIRLMLQPDPFQTLVLFVVNLLQVLQPLHIHLFANFGDLLQVDLAYQCQDHKVIRSACDHDQF